MSFFKKNFSSLNSNNSLPHSSDMEDDQFSKVANPIQPPENTPPKRTHTIESSFDELIPVKKQKSGKNKNIINRSVIADNLHSRQTPNLNKKDLPHTKRRSKSHVYIASTNNAPDVDMLSQVLEHSHKGVSDDMKFMDVDGYKERAVQRESEFQKYLRAREERDRTSNGPKKSITKSYIDAKLDSSTFSTSDIGIYSEEKLALSSFSHGKDNQKKQSAGELSIGSLLLGTEKKESLKKEFEYRKPYITPKILAKKTDIVKLVNTYKDIVSGILNGEVGSYFYNDVKRLQQGSKLMTIKDDEIINLPKNKYYGYIGAVRGFHIGKAIQENPDISLLLRKKMKFNKVIKFLGIDNFTQYVLAPEIIAHLTMKIGKLPDLDSAYDEMEETNQYGMFVTNTYELESDVQVETIDTSSQEEMVSTTLPSTLLVSSDDDHTLDDEDFMNTISEAILSKK